MSILVRGALVVHSALSLSLTRSEVLRLLPPTAFVPFAAGALERDGTNSNAVFQNDFYYKYGKLPSPLGDDGKAEFPGKPVFVRMQTRYDAYSKYSAKINIGLDAFRSLKATDDKITYVDVVLLALRPMGLLANVLLATESETNELLLARYYINQAYFALADLQETFSRSPDDANDAIDLARVNLNSFITIVNRAIPPDRIGPQFGTL